MPHKPIDLSIGDIPEWVLDLENECLKEMIIEALYTRDKAIRFGAFDRKKTRAVLLSGDATLEQISFGKYISEKAACNKASVAMRKYASVYERLTGMTAD